MVHRMFLMIRNQEQADVEMGTSWSLFITMRQGVMKAQKFGCS